METKGEFPGDLTFQFDEPSKWHIDPRFNVYIHKSAEIGKNCTVSSGIVVHEGVQIGDNVIVQNNVVIYRNAKIGSNTQIHNGVVVHPDTRVGGGNVLLDYTNIGRQPEIAGLVARQLKEEYQPLIIGDECLIGPFVKIYRGSVIGNRVSIFEFATVREECEIGDLVVLAPGVTVNYQTSIGKRTRIMHATHLTGGMVIEEDVFISLHVGSTNDKMIEKNTNNLPRWRGAIIRRGAVIGAGVMLAPGVEVGEGSHIGMQSVTTKDVPPGVFAMGAPLRVIRHLIHERSERTTPHLP